VAARRRGGGAMSGPLAGVRVIEMEGIGPGPFCAMLLADMGAEVLQIRAARARAPQVDFDRGVTMTARGRQRLTLDLKAEGGAEALLDLVAGADVLIEGFRPGVMERLGVGPEPCLARNPALVYGRMTGWGQDGPLAHAAGHDINYIALTGVLAAIGEAGRGPAVPLNLVGDYGGGGMLLATGVLAALIAARAGGGGQVVDAAMSEGAALLSTPIREMRAKGLWPGGRGENMLDGGAPFYGTYECADGGWLAVGPIEPQFWDEMLRLMALDPAEFAGRDDRARWPALRGRLERAFATRTRDDWARLFEGSDACVAPVLDWDEAAEHPHNRARGSCTLGLGGLPRAPAPRFSATPSRAPPAPRPADPAAWGIDPDRAAALREAGVLTPEP